MKDAVFYWCSTKVDSYGYHVEGNWGSCDSGCPKGQGMPKCLKSFKIDPIINNVVISKNIVITIHTFKAITVMR